MPGSSMTIRDANALSDSIRAQLTESVAPGRPEGTDPTPYMLHEFFLSKLERRLRPLEKVRKQGQRPVEALKRAKRQDALRRFFGKPTDEVTSADVARVPLRELERVAGYGAKEAAELRFAALGITLKRREKRTEDSGGKKAR